MPLTGSQYAAGGPTGHSVMQRRGEPRNDALVSVIVPVYNGEPFLRESLESILGQTYEALEVIVMDDASTDASAAIAAELSATDRRLTVRRQERNVGQFANVNAGLELARGDLLAVYHADDVYHPDIVAREVAFLEQHPDAGAVFTLCALIDDGGREIGRVDRLPAGIARAGLVQYPSLLDAVLRHRTIVLPTPSALVRRAVYEDVGLFSTAYGLRGDLEMWLRIARSQPIGVLEEILFRYRVGSHNESMRYSFLRTEPDLLFEVLDDRLVAGDRDLIDPDAVRAYETHRAGDLLEAARNAYAVADRVRLRELLDAVRAGRGGRDRLRPRLLLLTAALTVLGRLPHSGTVAQRLRRRAEPRSSGGAVGVEENA
jgi:GT2 family glycosyltransferase